MCIKVSQSVSQITCFIVTIICNLNVKCILQGIFELNIFIIQAGQEFSVFVNW